MLTFVLAFFDQLKVLPKVPHVCMHIDVKVMMRTVSGNRL